MARIGEIIRVLRIKHGYSQAQLAEMLGLKRSAIGNYEQGTREPDLDTIEALADLFDVPLAALIGRDERDYSKTLHENINSFTHFDKDTGIDGLLHEKHNELMLKREILRRDPKRKALFDLAEHGSDKDVDAAVTLLDALRKTNPDFYDGDDPA